MTGWAAGQPALWSSTILQIQSVQSREADTLTIYTTFMRRHMINATPGAFVQQRAWIYYHPSAAIRLFQMTTLSRQDALSKDHWIRIADELLYVSTPFRMSLSIIRPRRILGHMFDNVNQVNKSALDLSLCQTKIWHGLDYGSSVGWEVVPASAVPADPWSGAFKCCVVECHAAHPHGICICIRERWST